MGGGGRGGVGVVSQANMLRGKPNSFSRGPVAGLLCVVGKDYNPHPPGLDLVPSVRHTLQPPPRRES